MCALFVSPTHQAVDTDSTYKIESLSEGIVPIIPMLKWGTKQYRARQIILAIVVSKFIKILEFRAISQEKTKDLLRKWENWR